MGRGARGRAIVLAALAALALALLVLGEPFAEPFAEAFEGAEVPVQVPVAVISLRDDAESAARRERLADRMRALGVVYEVVDAVDGRTVPEYGASALSPGQRGCAKSHATVWAAHAGRHVLVLEDDARLIDEWHERFDAVRRAVPRDVDAVFLGHCAESRGRPVDEGARLYESRHPRCTHGYYLTPRGSAKLARWAAETPPTQPVDEELADLVRSGKLRATSCFPPLVTICDEGTSVLRERVDAGRR